MQHEPQKNGWTFVHMHAWSRYFNMCRRHIAIILALTLCLPSSVIYAAAFEDGAFWYQVEEYQRAFPILQKLSNESHPDALFLLGQMYDGGKGVKADPQKAFHLWREAHKGGSLHATEALAFVTLMGRGTENDSVRAFELFLDAGMRGSKEAMENLGLLFETGTGTIQNYRKSVYWYTAAVEAGDVSARLPLARMLYEGTGTKRDLNKAAALFTSLATLGSGEAQFELARMYQRGEGVPKDLMLAYMWLKIAIGELSQSPYLKTKAEAISLFTKIESDLDEDKLIQAKNLANICKGTVYQRCLVHSSFNPWKNK